MSEACATCGQSCVKTKGSYREYCQTCLSKMAADTRHVEQCDKNDCLVCRDKLEEIQQVVQPLFVRVLLERRTGAVNKTLGEYQ